MFQKETSIAILHSIFNRPMYGNTRCPMLFVCLSRHIIKQLQPAHEYHLQQDSMVINSTEWQATVDQN